MKSYLVPRISSCLAVVGMFLSGGFCHAEVHIVQVEEDWEIVLDNPDPKVVGPQVSTVMSPTTDTQSTHMTFEMNHRSLPTFAGGGLQLNVWDNEELIVTRPHIRLEILSTNGETIRWTQQMSTQGSLIRFEIIDGVSSTWGHFGGGGHLKAVVNSPFANLDSYNYDVSLKNSGVGFAANRVQSLTLRQVRVKTSDGQSRTLVLNKAVALNNN